MIHNADQKQPRMLTLAGGGWVLLATGLLCLILIAWAVGPAVLRTINRPPGDGKHIESYGFDLSSLQLPREERDLIVPAMLHRDMVPVMTNPTASDVASMQRINDPKYGKYLVPGDLVIGVEIDGVTRAYPISVMYVHEIINDTLGVAGNEAPIAVTYHWPCDSAVVFDRRVDGEAREFRVSGLVYNSNLLMYDQSERSAAGDERTSESLDASLWSQLLGRAISGPKAGKELKVIAAELTRWDNWVARHPETTVLNRNVAMAARYKDAAPTGYFQSDDLLFPVRPLPPTNGPAPKTRVIALSCGEARRVYPMPLLIKRARAGAEHDSPSWTDMLGSETVRFNFDQTLQTVRVEVDDPKIALRVTHAFWFAWHAMYPEDELAN